jgi:hypothetical protein
MIAVSFASVPLLVKIDFESAPPPGVIDATRLANSTTGSVTYTLDTC